MGSYSLVKELAIVPYIRLPAAEVRTGLMVEYSS